MRLSTIAMAITLQGCALLQPGNTIAIDQIATAADTLRLAGELALCRAITVGAWMRAYGDNPPLAAAWRTLCAPHKTETPAPATQIR